MINNFTFEQLVLAPLTERQIEVLQLIAATYSKREVAKILVISKKTVDGHIDHILEKVKIDWTSEPTPRIQRLTLIWERFKKNITDFSKVELTTLDELLTKKGYQNDK